MLHDNTCLGNCNLVKKRQAERKKEENDRRKERKMEDSC